MVRDSHLSVGDPSTAQWPFVYLLPARSPGIGEGGLPREKPIDPFMASLPLLKRKKQRAGREASGKRLSLQVGHNAHSYHRDELPIAQGTFLVFGFTQV